MSLIPLVPPLAPEDLGVELEEDSPDLTDEDVEGAVDTDNMSDFIAKLREFVKEIRSVGVLNHELRRRAGILYSRAISEDGLKRVFRVEWLRRGS